MCANYLPASPRALPKHFNAPEPTFGYAEVYPGGMAPLIVSAGGARATVPAVFGLLPHFAKDLRFARRTYNARSETVSEKPSFRNAWSRHQFGLAPVQAFFEPCWGDGKAVRWRIQRKDDMPFGLACIWSLWRHEDIERHSLALLTINAEASPLMRQFHRPEDEKRSVVVVPAERFIEWLSADATKARQMLQQIDGSAFMAVPDPKTGRKRD